MSLERSDEAVAALHGQWRAGFALHVEAIVYGSGRVLLLDGRTIRSGTNLRTVVSPRADTTVSSVLKYANDPWSPLTRLATLGVSQDVQVECGEGAMGNEGYVAAVNRADGSLNWILFSTHSNPFVSLVLKGGDVLAEGGYDQVWRIPLEMPERVVIT